MGHESGCRCEQDQQAGTEGSHRWLLPLVFVLFVVGFWAAALYISAVPAADRFGGAEAEAGFRLWVALVGAVGGYALAAGACFVGWLVGVLRLFVRVRPTSVLSWVAVVLVAGGMVLGSLFAAAATAEESVDKALATQTRPISLAVGLCMTPGLVAFVALRSVAVAPENWLESGSCRLRLLLRLRSELRRLLGTAGGFLTVLVVTTGVRRRALLALQPDVTVPSEAVLLYGLIFAALLGLFYMAANAAINGQAQRLVDDFAPLPDPADETLSDRLARRADLVALVGGGGSWRTFETGVVIAGPLLTALISSATSG
jgi:hypothetical protein